MIVYDKPIDGYNVYSVYPTWDSDFGAAVLDMYVWMKEWITAPANLRVDIFEAHNLILVDGLEVLDIVELFGGETEDVLIGMAWDLVHAFVKRATNGFKDDSSN